MVDDFERIANDGSSFVLFDMVSVSYTHLDVYKRQTQFTLPDGQRPDRYYHSLICALDEANLNAENIEIVQVARQIVNPGDNHKFFDEIIARMDFARAVGLNKLVDLLSLTAEWTNIKANIKNWLDNKRNLVIED